VSGRFASRLGAVRKEERAVVKEMSQEELKAIIGMKTALNIKIEPVANGTTVDAGVGIFGQQAIPTAITLLVFWPVIIAQVWNMAHESKLDEEALGVAEESLKSHSEAPSEATAQ
jgi:hypothetical protein